MPGTHLPSTSTHLHPQPQRRREQIRTPSESDSGDPLLPPSVFAKANIDIPKTPANRSRTIHQRPAKYWLEKPAGYRTRDAVPLYEDIWQRVRLDWMILFDLRLWKKARTDLRDLYISTVVTFLSLILGLRFAGLYTTLAQLYLIADREPDHSIINLSLQMLTTPSITEEVVERGNFLTNLIAISTLF
jgi:E3 ubiquitin-protein ligase UBR1